MADPESREPIRASRGSNRASAKQARNRQRSAASSSVLPVSERDTQRTILDWLEMKHIFHWRNNSGAMTSTYRGKQRFMRFGAVGSPDIFALRKGIIYGIEVKGPKGRLSEDQDRWRTGFMVSGGFYLIAYKLEDVTCWLDPESH